MDPAARSRALAEWSAALGAANVRADGEAVARYARSTAPRGPVPGAVLYPASLEQVQEGMRIAARHGLPGHPISRGRNGGYGDARPAADGKAVLGLGRA